MENFNLLNLPNSEKLVAILDGELHQNDAGNFFQELAQNQDLQEQFFDLIQIKNNLNTGFITPPSNLKNNIMKGVGLVAASTLTYQTIATNQFNLWQNILATLNSKIAIGLISALSTGLITFGIMDYNSKDRLNNENSNSYLSQKDNRQTKNINSNSNISFEDSIKSNSKNKIPISKSNNNFASQNVKINNNDLNSKNGILDRKINSRFNNKVNKYSIDNNVTNNNLTNKNVTSNNETSDSKNSDFIPSNLIPGKVPDSYYKVEKRSYKNNELELNKLDTQNNNLDIQNLSNLADKQINLNSNNDNQTPIESDIDFELDVINGDKINKNKYSNEVSNLSMMFRNFNSTTIQQIDAPKLQDPIINNIAAGLLFDLNNNWSIGVEIGQENFEQEFKATNDNSSINIQQNYLAFWGGVVARYYFNPSIEKENFRPYVNVLVGSTDIGPLIKPSLGVTYNISNNFSLFVAGEFTNLYSKYNSVWYNSTKYGLTYGFIMRF